MCSIYKTLGREIKAVLTGAQVLMAEVTEGA